MPALNVEEARTMRRLGITVTRLRARGGYKPARGVSAICKTATPSRMRDRG